MGSSVGVSRASSAEEFDKACERAFSYDGKVLVERSVTGAREIECSVLEDAAGEVSASPLGEIVPADSHGFYSYDAKYIDADGALLRIPAELSTGPGAAHPGACGRDLQGSRLRRLGARRLLRRSEE